MKLRDDTFVICSSNCCPERFNCYRHEAQEEEHQQYHNYEYTCNENSGFQDFIKYKRGDSK